MKVVVLIPCYNEELTIEKVVKDFKKELPEADIYVYDNNSQDRTYEIAKNAGAIVRKENRQGKGNVVRTMFREIDADIYIMVDGDDTYPAEFIHQLMEPVIKGEADMAIGDRLSTGTYQKQVKKNFHEFGNNLVIKTINFLFKCKLKDIMTGYRVFNRTFVKNIPIMSQNFELETEMTLFSLDKRFRIKEIPIEFRERPDGSESKINTFSDGIKVLKTIIKMFKDFKPRQFFWLIAIIFTVIGLIIGIPVIIEFIKTGVISKMPSAVLSTGIMIFSIVTAQCGVILDTVVKQNKENYELQLQKYILLEKMNNEKNNI